MSRVKDNNIIVLYNDEVLFVYVNRKYVACLYEKWELIEVLEKVAAALINKGNINVYSFDLGDIYFDEDMLLQNPDMQHEDIMDMFMDSEYITELEEYAIINKNAEYLEQLILERLYITG